jgi:uncharacterized protein YcbX
MHVTRLARYPVKSFQGEFPESVEIDQAGVDGDRRWAVIDRATGKALSAKREPRLLDAAARSTTAGPTVTLPDGAEYECGDPILDKALAAWLGLDVRLEQAAAAQPRAYEFNISSEDEQSPVVDIACPAGTFLDLAAVHVLTTASVAAIAERYPEGQWALPRFRPTILVDDAGDGFVEDAWVGGTVTIGGVVLQPFMPTVRCAMVTRAQQGLPRDVDIAKTINREHGGSLGVYCVVTQPGPVALGDPVAVD